MASAADKVINYDQFDFKNSTVIKPPRNTFELNKHHTIVVIDSRDRDTTVYPTPSDYVIELDEELQDVVSAELVTAKIPFKSYVINTNNNQLTVNSTGVIKTITLEPANYDASSLASALQNDLNNAFLGRGAGWQVQYIPIYDKFKILCSAAFQLLIVNDETKDYIPKTMGKVLGFGRQNYQVTIPGSIGDYTIVAPYRKNFEDVEYVVLNIDTFTVNYSVNSIVNKSFAIVPNSKNEMNIISNNQRIIKNFNPPVPRLGKIRVSFTDFYGNRYDFQNHDHRIEIVFESFQQKRGYQPYFDN